LAGEKIIGLGKRGNQRVLKTGTNREIAVDGVVAGVERGGRSFGASDSVKGFFKVNPAVPLRSVRLPVSRVNDSDKAHQRWSLFRTSAPLSAGGGQNRWPAGGTRRNRSQADSGESERPLGRDIFGAIARQERSEGWLGARTTPGGIRFPRAKAIRWLHQALSE
jgi:hypothetical protein